MEAATRIPRAPRNREGSTRLAAMALLALLPPGLLIQAEARAEDEAKPETKEELKPEPKGFFARTFKDRQVGLSVEFLKMESTEGAALIGTGAGQGYGVSIKSGIGNRHFEANGTVRYSLQEGTAHLEHDGTLNDFPFILSAGEAVFGVNLNLLSGTMKELQPYVGVAYTIGIAHLSMTGTPNVETDISGSSIGFVYGPELRVGVTVVDHLVLEAQLHQTASKIGSLPKLSVGGGSFSLGYRW